MGMLPKFESTVYKCSECKSTSSSQKDRNGNPRWYKNKEKGIGFICKKCYMVRYHRKRLAMRTV